MEEGVIVLSYCILLICATTFFFYEYLYCASITLYTEEDSHQGSKRLYL